MVKALPSRNHEAISRGQVDDQDHGADRQPPGEIEQGGHTGHAPRGDLVGGGKDVHRQGVQHTAEQIKQAVERCALPNPLLRVFSSSGPSFPAPCPAGHRGIARPYPAVSPIAVIASSKSSRSRAVSPTQIEIAEQGFQPRRLMIRPVGPGRAGVASPPVDRRFPLGQEGEQPVGRDGLGLPPAPAPPPAYVGPGHGPPAGAAVPGPSAHTPRPRYTRDSGS